MEECPTPICLVQTHCIVMTQHFLILLFTLDKIKTGEVCKESVNDQRSCRGRSIRQAGAPTRMHVNQRCTSKYLRESLHTKKRQFLSVKKRRWQPYWLWRALKPSTGNGHFLSTFAKIFYCAAFLLSGYFTVHACLPSSRTGSIPFYNTSLQRLPTSFILGLLQYQIPPICKIRDCAISILPMNAITPWSLLTWQLPC